MTLTASKAILAVILCDGERAMRTCIERGVAEDWFPEIPDKVVWRACNALFVADSPVHGISVAHELANHKPTVDDRYLETLVDGLPPGAVSSIEHYIDTLCDERKREIARRGIAMAAGQIEGGAAPEAVIGDLLEHVVSANVEKSDERNKHESAKGVVDRWRNPDLTEGLMEWPTDGLNRLIGRMSGGLMFLCGQASTGKTALMLQACMHNHGRDTKTEGAYASLEMEQDDIAERMIQHLGQVNTWNLKNGQGSEDEFARADRGAELVKDYEFPLSTKSMDMMKLAAWSKSKVADGAAFVVVDNLKQLCPEMSPEAFGNVCGELVKLKKMLGVPLIVLHHLDDGGNVRWSKELKNDADYLITMEDDASGVGGDPGVGHVTIKTEKLRGGDRRQQRTLKFDKTTQTFSDHNVEAQDFDEDDNGGW